MSLETYTDQASRVALETAGYWIAWSIPLILVVLGVAIQKLVDGDNWSRRHFYIGLDLMTYCLAAALVNLVDLSRSATSQNNQYMWDALFLAVTTVALVLQISLHADFEKRNTAPVQQIFWLCVLSNVAGTAFLYGFVRLKLKGVI